MTGCRCLSPSSHAPVSCGHFVITSPLHLLGFLTSPLYFACECTTTWEYAFLFLFMRRSVVFERRRRSIGYHRYTQRPTAFVQPSSLKPSPPFFLYFAFSIEPNTVQITPYRIHLYCRRSCIDWIAFGAFLLCFFCFGNHTHFGWRSRKWRGRISFFPSICRRLEGYSFLHARSCERFLFSGFSFPSVGWSYQRISY